jgi:hypothetical protein
MLANLRIKVKLQNPFSWAYIGFICAKKQNKKLLASVP